MKLLVAYASRMGSNAEIARRTGRYLVDAGHVVDVRACGPDLISAWTWGVVRALASDRPVPRP